MKLNDWRGEIAQMIQRNCSHGPESLVTSQGCVDCQGLYLDVLAAVDQGLDWLTEQPELITRPQDAVATFRRSVPR